MKRRIVPRLVVPAGIVALLAAVILTHVLSGAADGDTNLPTTPTPIEEAHTALGERLEKQSEAGATAFALGLAAAAQSWLYLSDNELDVVVRSVAAAESAERVASEVLSDVRAAREALARTPGRVWWVVRPLAWRVDSYTAARSLVSVWSVSVLSAADVAMPQADWTTTVFELVWEPEGWRLLSSSDMPGPTPQLGGTDHAWEPEPFDEALDGFQRVGAGEEP